MDTLNHRDDRWNELELDTLQNDWEMSFFNQQPDYGDCDKGEWYSADTDHTFPDGSRVIFGGSFGNYNSPGASDYTYAELYGPNEHAEYLARVAELGGYPEYLESDDE